jgi:hypothetical protein
MAKLPSHIVSQTFKRLIKDSTTVGSSGRLMVGKCPLCEDWKKRMYLKEYNDQYMVYCHNCGYSKPFPLFIKEEFPTEWDQVKIHFLDSLRTGEIFKKEKRQPKQVNNGGHSDKLKFYLEKFGFSINVEQKEINKEKYRIKCLNYLKDRKIPEDVYIDFYCMVGGPLKGYIGIPFFNEDKSKLLHVQGRLIIKNPKAIKEQAKYLFLKDEKEGIEIDSKPLWGLWRVDKVKTVIVCEGTLDACAFRNGIATCGVTMSQWFINNVKKLFPDVVWAMDNYFSDKEGCKRIKKLLSAGETCFNIPFGCSSKDANDFLKEMNIDYIEDEIIKSNLYEGKTGLVKLKIKTMKKRIY